MTTNNKSISRFSVVVLGALLVGLPATAVFAAEPPSAPEAQAMAQHYREQADHYRAFGGVGYKSGLVQRAEADVARYTALAERLQSPVASSSARSPEAQAMAERYREQAKHYRALGGAGYKTGLVQRAEADAAKYTALAERMQSPVPAVRSPEAQRYADLAMQYRAMGGVGYKAGLVQWAEAQQIKHEAAVVNTSPPTPFCLAGMSTERMLTCAR